MSHKFAWCGTVLCKPSGGASLGWYAARVPQKPQQLKVALSRCNQTVCRRTSTAYANGHKLVNTVNGSLLRHSLPQTERSSKWIINFSRNYAAKSPANKGADFKEKNPFLMVGVYSSLLIGAFVWVAIFFKVFKRKRLEGRGIFELKVPEWGRMQMYTCKDFVIPDFVVKNIDDIEKFETDETDVWVVSFPRSGTTWLQEIVYLIHSNLDYTTANLEYLDDRFPYFEYVYPGVGEVQKKSAPRLIKSHLPWPLMPDSVKQKQPKIIYIARNPKDVCVSYYYFTRLLNPITKYKGNFKQYFNLFVEDKVMYGPWWKHVQQYWEMKEDPNVLYLTYEDLKRDTLGMIDKISSFLGKNLSADEKFRLMVHSSFAAMKLLFDTLGTIDKISSFLGKNLSADEKFRLMVHCSFAAMKRNEMTNHRWFERFGVSDPKEGECMRKGCVGDWANHFTNEMNTRMHKMLAERFDETGPQFAYSGTHFTPDTNSDQPENGCQSGLPEEPVKTG